MTHRPTRRDFHQFSLAALTGALAGATLGCTEQRSDQENKENDTNDPSAETKTAGNDAQPDVRLLLSEKHICRGLNTCRGKGGCGETKGKNECAGQGNCATVEHHACGGDHDCKGQSGCGQTAGINACKNEGHCAVPVMQGAWEIARSNFEKLMKEQGREVGPAPPRKEE